MNMESVVPCPSCGEMVRVALEPNEGILKMMGLLTEGSDLQFAGDAKCACGKSITVIWAVITPDGCWLMPA